MAKIQNVHLLEDIFGYFPSFHDAEVLQILLDRDGEGRLPTLEARIHVFEISSEVVDGSYVLRNHTLVTFQFIDADDIRLEGFNHQNELQGLSIKDISDQQLEWLKFEVRFDGNLGMDLRFRCREVRIVGVEPFPS